MTQEEKQLLLRDICARLPYGVKISTRIKGNLNFRDSELSGELLDDFIKKDWGVIKPYLRQMSNMTWEEKFEYDKFINYSPSDKIENQLNKFDWLNAHHFDYRSLIEKGLAIEAPENMYNT